MTTLTITFDQDIGARELVKAAFDNEVRVLDAAIRRTKARIAAFEERFKTVTTDFMKRYEAGEIDESLETDEWIGEHRMLERLQVSRDALCEAHLAD